MEKQKKNGKMTSDVKFMFKIHNIHNMFLALTLQQK